MDIASKQNASAFVAEVERCYAALIAAADAGVPSGAEEPSLGGKLLYVGELDAPGQAVVVGGNIAGAASLAATADPDAQKQAIRDGVVDFLVTSLDEALRILKNEIRKRETVAVCVGGAPEDVEREMKERGVLPDLVFAGGTGATRSLPQIGESATRNHLGAAGDDQAFVTWQVTETPARWMPKLDAIAVDCLSPFDLAARRWLHLAPRYCGRPALGVRVLRCDPQTAKRLVERISNAVKRGEIGVEVSISTNRDAETHVYYSTP